MRQAQARTRHLYDLRVFLVSDNSTRSVKLSLPKYSVDGASAEDKGILGAADTLRGRPWN